MKVYLDNAATTPLDPQVIETMHDVMQNVSGNPSSIHQMGRSARMVIEEARKTVANAIGASIGEIFFTSGGTESNNMALKCAVRDLGVTRIITCPLEHHCVLHTVKTLEKYNNITKEYVQINDKGVIDLGHLKALLANSDAKTLVSIMHSNNEIGTLNDIQAISELCVAHNAYFHTDTVQTMGYFPIDVSKVNISFCSAGGHKFYGPKGVGFIYINSNNIIKPYIDGGAQERNMRGGTENIYGISGIAKALEIKIERMEADRAHIEEIRAYMKAQLTETFEDIHFHGNQENYHYKVLSVCFPKSDKSELLLWNLDINGICASGGSACSSGVEGGSHVLHSLGGDPERKTIRFSFSHWTKREEIDFTIEKLKSMVAMKKELI